MMKNNSQHRYKKQNKAGCTNSDERLGWGCIGPNGKTEDHQTKIPTGAEFALVVCRHGARTDKKKLTSAQGTYAKEYG